MRRLVLAVVVFCLAFTLSIVPPAWAGDAASGAKIFAANCASCHLNGKNVVNAEKTLQKAALDKYGMNSVEAIVTQINKGKMAMPAFLGRLSKDDIEDVATYVLAKAEAGW